MAVLNTTSPTDRPFAPTETPSNTVPSSRTRIAVWVTGFAYVRLQKTAGAVLDRSGGMRNQASENDTGPRPLAPDGNIAGTEWVAGCPLPFRRRLDRVARTCSAARRPGITRAEQVAHPVQPRPAPGKAAGGMQRTTREDVAVGCTVNQFDALTHRCELHQVLADDVACAQRGIARLRATASGRLPERERGARRRVLFLRVVGFDDVAVPARQRSGTALDQFFEHRHAQAEVGCPQYRDRLRRLAQRATLAIRDPGRAGHESRASRRAQRQHRIEALGQAEIDGRSEEHTSELQSRENLVCRLLLEKKKKDIHNENFLSK